MRAGGESEMEVALMAESLNYFFFCDGAFVIFSCLQYRRFDVDTESLCLLLSYQFFPAISFLLFPFDFYLPKGFW